MVKAEEIDNFYRIPADMRDLNYSEYKSSLNKEINIVKEYTSENTQRLSVDEIVEKLLKLDYIQTELKTKEFIGVLR